MSLRDEIKTLNGNKRKFFLMRIADLDTKTAREVVGVTTVTYNSWLRNQDFVDLYRRRDEFTAEYKQEAIQLLRRDNQLAAVLLEGKIIGKIKEELDTGDYNLIRTHLAKEVYSKLITDLDVTPQVQLISWQQRVSAMNPVVEDGTPKETIVDGKFKEIGLPENQHSESKPCENNEQATNEVEEVIEEDE
jgi:hypothetical protein